MAASTPQTAAGTIIGISASIPTAFTLAGYDISAMDYTAIGEITDGGTHGQKYNVVTHLPLSARGVQKFKGSFNNGTKTIQLAMSRDDAGQQVVAAALLSDANYAFRVIYQSGDRDFFSAKVVGFEKSTPNVDSIVSATLTLEIDSPSGSTIVEYNAP